jgi:hypothetical protein
VVLIGRGAAVCAALGLLAGGCTADLDRLDAQVQQVCIRDLPTGFGAGAGAATAVVNRSNLSLDDDDLADRDAALAEGTLALAEVAMVPLFGIDHFGFVSQVRVRVGDIPLVAIVADPDTQPEHLRGAAVSPTPNLMEHVRAGEVAMTVEFSGQMPTSPWAIAMSACFDVEGVEITLVRDE